MNTNDPMNTIDFVPEVKLKQVGPFATYHCDVCGELIARGSRIVLTNFRMNGAYIEYVACCAMHLNCVGDEIQKPWDYREETEGCAGLVRLWQWIYGKGATPPRTFDVFDKKWRRVGWLTTDNWALIYSIEQFWLVTCRSVEETVYDD